MIEDIKKHEGFRSKVYKCTEGYETIGYGFAIKDLELTEDIAELILKRKLSELQLRVCKNFEWYIDSPQTVQDVVMNMCYQLGLSGFSKFKKTIYYLETEQYEEAADEMLDSLWAKQTPNRAKELSNAIRDLA
tara:strand:- start:724 stop:1122 length:399 start_codon:yes stop_codon:yes gene_type:complete